jgi:hypothetical protein
MPTISCDDSSSLTDIHHSFVRREKGRLQSRSAILRRRKDLNLRTLSCVDLYALAYHMLSKLWAPPGLTKRLCRTRPGKIVYFIYDDGSSLENGDVRTRLEV